MLEWTKILKLCMLKTSEENILNIFFYILLKVHLFASIIYVTNLESGVCSKNPQNGWLQRFYMKQKTEFYSSLECTFVVDSNDHNINNQTNWNGTIDRRIVYISPW